MHLVHHFVLVGDLWEFMNISAHSSCFQEVITNNSAKNGRLLVLVRNRWEYAFYVTFVKGFSELQRFARDVLDRLYMSVT